MFCRYAYIFIAVSEYHLACWTGKALVTTFVRCLTTLVNPMVDRVNLDLSLQLNLMLIFVADVLMVDK